MATTFPLVKEDAFEAIRMVLRKDHEMAGHQVEWPITIYCLDGQIAFTARGQTHDLRAGHWLFLLGNEPHSLRAIEDSSFLLTILFHRSSSERRSPSDVAGAREPNLPSSLLTPSRIAKRQRTSNSSLAIAMNTDNSEFNLVNKQSSFQNVDCIR